MALFEIKPIDRKIYEEQIRDFLPDEIIDIHTHVWLDRFRKPKKEAKVQLVTWPDLVAKDDPIEDLVESYRLMFPDKKVTPMIFSSLRPDDDMDGGNNYVRQSAEKYGFPALLYASPKWSESELERRLKEGRFLGCKAFLDHAAPYIPENEIRVFDFFTPSMLNVLNRYGLIAMLHLPRSARLKDPVNVAQMLEIEEKYPNVKLIIAHVGRAYCEEDLGNALDILSETKNMMFDFSANCNPVVFEKLIRAMGTKRIMFGSDMPILRMRMRRECVNGRYVNVIQKGMYGDVSNDSHMREIVGEESEQLTFFMYEEIKAFRQAAERTGLTKKDVMDAFYGNARHLLDNVEENLSNMLRG